MTVLILSIIFLNTYGIEKDSLGRYYEPTDLFDLSLSSVEIRMQDRETIVFTYRVKNLESSQQQVEWVDFFYPDATPTYEVYPQKKSAEDEQKMVWHFTWTDARFQPMPNPGAPTRLAVGFFAANTGKYSEKRLDSYMYVESWDDHLFPGETLTVTLTQALKTTLPGIITLTAKGVSASPVIEDVGEMKFIPGFKNQIKYKYYPTLGIIPREENAEKEISRTLQTLIACRQNHWIPKLEAYLSLKEKLESAEKQIVSSPSGAKKTIQDFLALLEKEKDSAFKFQGVYMMFKIRGEDILKRIN